MARKVSKKTQQEWLERHGYWEEFIKRREALKSELELEIGDSQERARTAWAKAFDEYYKKVQNDMRRMGKAADIPDLVAEAPKPEKVPKKAWLEAKNKQVKKLLGEEKLVSAQDIEWAYGCAALPAEDVPWDTLPSTGALVLWDDARQRNSRFLTTFHSQIALLVTSKQEAADGHITDEEARFRDRVAGFMAAANAIRMSALPPNPQKSGGECEVPEDCLGGCDPE